MEVIGTSETETMLAARSVASYEEVREIPEKYQTSLQVIRILAESKLKRGGQVQSIFSFHFNGNN
jgi:hypothetical protein